MYKRQSLKTKNLQSRPKSENPYPNANDMWTHTQFPYGGAC